MRRRLSDGHPEAPLLLYVGRLGVEKKIHRLKKVLEKNPSCRLVLVGKGPAEVGLRETFKDLPVHFAGQLVGKKTNFSCQILNVATFPLSRPTSAGELRSISFCLQWSRVYLPQARS
jgi:glycosyltransferase involved in cell wall biosynthesis